MRRLIPESIALTLGVARVAGDRSTALQYAAHLFLLGLLVAYLGRRRAEDGRLIVLLSVLETTCFALGVGR